LGSLVKLELPEVYADNREVTLIHKPVVLDPFLMPGKEGVEQNSQNKNEWVPFHLNKAFIIRNTTALPMVSDNLYKQELSNNFNTIPVFIMNGILRI
jgi:hypothetical protein